MFTGIVAAIGRIVSSTPLEGGVRLTIDAGALGLADVAIGDSIAVDGCCLTAIGIEANTFLADVSEETLRCTTGLAVGREVNLEKALRLADRLGGHLVTGHVDGIGETVRFEQINESWLLCVRAPVVLAKYIARKGSITINGVSLTVNQVSGDQFEVNLIPHTVQVTALKHLQAGGRVNLEVDLIARYVERMVSASVYS
ncbi:MAG TPA: riboflavin synthase [Burkholderiales bacterium]|nr:riboflavin synthase [Burkholderiales bacterium]